MIQAQLAADALRRRFPEHEFELTPMTTHADRHPSMRLSDAPREGVFVQELVLAFDVRLPAPGQGALALQALEGSEAARLAAQLDDPPTRRAVSAERELLRRLGGGCLSAIGAYARVEDNRLVLDAVVLAVDGRRVLRAQAEGADDAQVVEKVSDGLDAQGARRLLRGAPSAGPLDGLRVMVTRADQQAAALARALEAQGAVAVVCPVIE